MRGAANKGGEGAFVKQPGGSRFVHHCCPERGGWGHACVLGFGQSISLLSRDSGAHPASLSNLRAAFLTGQTRL